jgi:hypothetical protein
VQRLALCKKSKCCELEKKEKGQSRCRGAEEDKHLLAVVATPDTVLVAQGKGIDVV